MGLVRVDNFATIRLELSYSQRIFADIDSQPNSQVRSMWKTRKKSSWNSRFVSVDSQHQNTHTTFGSTVMQFGFDWADPTDEEQQKADEDYALGIKEWLDKLYVVIEGVKAGDLPDADGARALDEALWSLANTFGEELELASKVESRKWNEALMANLKADKAQ